MLVLCAFMGEELLVSLCSLGPWLCALSSENEDISKITGYWI